MKYWIYIKVLLTKLFVYKAGIYLAGIAFVLGAVYGSTLTMGLAVMLYGIVALAFIFRGYTRNTVDNYVLQNDIHLPRLWERNPKLVDGYYCLDDIHDVSVRNDIKIQGRIKYRKVSTIEYLVARFLWKWVDDDSNHDTMSGKDRTAEGMVYGNTFDLGDVRAEYPQWDWKESIAWFIRNTGYNANYMDEECAEGGSKYFYYKTKEEHWTLKIVEGSVIPYPVLYKSYWHFGYIPYTNSERKGRMVWFAEDINKLD